MLNTETKDREAKLFIDSHGTCMAHTNFHINDYDAMMIVCAVPGRKYVKSTQKWIIPITQRNVQTLIRHRFKLDDNILSYIKQKKEQKELLIENGVDGLIKTLYPFQNEGVAFVEGHSGRALIADEMGLGKTVQALGWIQLHRDVTPVVIVVPASLKLNWQREVITWLPNPSVEILEGSSIWRTKKEILIINYDILWVWMEELQRRNPQLLITDECHYYKNNKAKRTKAVKLLSKRIPYFIALSGTPIYNYPVEIYNAWQLIDPGSCPDKWYYLKHFCDAKRNGFGWDFNGASNIDELHKKLTSTIMIRRLKKDVLPDLPPKITSFIPIELNNINEYRTAERDYIAFVKVQKGAQAAKKASNAEAFSKTEGLKQLAVRGKMKQVTAWIDDFLSIKQKLVVFVTHHFTMDLIMQEFKSVAVKMDGSTSSKARQEAVDRFQTNDRCKLFVGMIDVQGRPSGEGWTLTAASNVAFVELQWSPKTHDQAADRCHRIGQKDCVNVYYLLARNTIEEKIVKLLDKKRKTINGALDGGVTEPGSMLREIMEQYE